MSDLKPTSSQSPPSPPRPPSFMRRFAAGDTTDPDALVGLACDESYWVRRQAVKNPATPAWIIELLVRAGAAPDLRGKGEPDPTLDGDSLIKLVEGGPWARQLVAEHPNTPARVLEAPKDQPSPALRLAIARHPNVPGATLANLCCDMAEEIRAAAAAHPHRPQETIDLLIAAGATSDLRAATRSEAKVSEEQLRTLAGLAPWGRFLTARLCRKNSASGWRPAPPHRGQGRHCGHRGRPVVYLFRPVPDEALQV